MSSDILKLELKKTFASPIPLIIFMSVLFVIFSSFDLELNTKKTSIYCNKKENICNFTIEKFLFGKKVYKRPINSIGELEVFQSGTSKGHKYYELILPSTQGNLELISWSPNKTYLIQFAETFNQAINDTNVDDFNIKPSKGHYFSWITLMMSLFLLGSISLIFITGYKEEIIVDKVRGEIKVIFYRIIWSKVKKIKISKIKDFNIRNKTRSKLFITPSSYGYRGISPRAITYETVYFIEYTLFNNRKKRLISQYYGFDELKPILDELNEFLFNKKPQNETKSETNWIDKYLSSDENLKM